MNGLCRTLIWPALMLVTMLASIGCCNGEMRDFDVTVTLHDSLRDARGVFPSVEVDLVAVNSVDLPTWSSKSMTEYFESGDPLRSSADRMPVLLGDDHRSQTLSAKDKKTAATWDAWRQKGALYLLVLSSKPRVPDQPEDKDPRRRILPLGCDRWEGKVKQLNIYVTSGGVTVSPPPLPAK